VVVRSGNARPAPAGSETWSLIPPAPRQGRLFSAAPPAGSTSPGPVTEFERAALKLQFLVLVAASIHKPDEGVRRLAVELAGHGLPLQAADQIRLRALAHQYATGHGDLGQVVPRLRATLGDLERTQLLDDVRRLAPATTELDELVAVYATDLGVSANVPPPRSPAPPTLSVVLAPSERAEEVPVDAKPSAGGIRTNAALDALFEVEPTS
jgi:hypothetical protein